jgi:hypothetical protein
MLDRGIGKAGPKGLEASKQIGQFQDTRTHLLIAGVLIFPFT